MSNIKATENMCIPALLVRLHERKRTDNSLLVTSAEQPRSSFSNKHKRRRYLCL